MSQQEIYSNIKETETLNYLMTGEYIQNNNATRLQIAIKGTLRLHLQKVSWWNFNGCYNPVPYSEKAKKTETGSHKTNHLRKERTPEIVWKLRMNGKMNIYTLEGIDM